MLHQLHLHAVRSHQIDDAVGELIRLRAEEPSNAFYMVVPTNVAEGDELSDELLEAVAGGYWVELLWTSICFGNGTGSAPAAASKG